MAKSWMKMFEFHCNKRKLGNSESRQDSFANWLFDFAKWFILLKPQFFTEELNYVISEAHGLR